MSICKFIDPSMDSCKAQKHCDVSIIIPIFNEKDNILELYNKLSKSLHMLAFNYEIIFINDGSRDGSAEVLDEIAEKDSCVLVIHFVRNYGQTAAIMAGIDASQGAILVPMDGDLQNDPEDIKHIVEKLAQGYDVVSGWRKERKDAKLTRNFPSRVANKLISFVSGVHLHDYGCSLKAYRREVLDGVRLYGEMHRFIPIYASWQGARVTEIPVMHHARLHGESKYGLNRIFKVLLDLCVIKFFERYLVKPIYVFGGVSLLAFFLSFCAVIGGIGLKLFMGIAFVQTPLPLFAGVAFLGGLNLLLMGVLAEILSRTYFESQDRRTYKIRAVTKKNMTAQCSKADD